jgi:predicted transcriptional regulator
MSGDFDKAKIIDSMFDPTTAEIIGHLEEGGKELSELSKLTKLSDNEILDNLSYLIQHNFITKETRDSGVIIISADAEKLASIVENDERFDGVIDGLTKMDSYLN